MDGMTEESKMSVFSKDSEDSETNLSWGDSPDGVSTCKALLMISVAMACLRGIEEPLDRKSVLE